MTQHQQRTAAGIVVIGFVLWFFYVPPGGTTVTLKSRRGPPDDWDYFGGEIPRPFWYTPPVDLVGEVIQNPADAEFNGRAVWFE